MNRQFLIVYKSAEIEGIIALLTHPSYKTTSWRVASYNSALAETSKASYHVLSIKFCSWSFKKAGSLYCL